MTGTEVAPAPAAAAPATYGVVITDTSHMGSVRNMLGGAGVAQWVALANGGHLPGAWGPVEYVVLEPGASCGQHLHAAREEFYYILSGDAVMHINGREVAVTAGELVTCPLGTVHGIGVPGTAGEPMTFFVAEVFPGQDPPGAVMRIPVRTLRRPVLGYRGYTGDDLCTASVDLSRHLSGPLQRFTEIIVPPEESLGPYQVPAGLTEILFVAAGQAEMALGADSCKGGPGLCAGLPPGTAVTVRNTSSRDHLTLVSTEARSQ